MVKGGRGGGRRRKYGFRIIFLAVRPVISTRTAESSSLTQLRAAFRRDSPLLVLKLVLFLTSQSVTMLHSFFCTCLAFCLRLMRRPSKSSILKAREEGRPNRGQMKSSREMDKRTTAITAHTKVSNDMAESILRARGGGSGSRRWPKGWGFGCRTLAIMD